MSSVISGDSVGCLPVPLCRVIPGASPSVSPASESNEYGAGDVIANRYRLRNLLGRGGMGVVWQAEALMLDVEVAIKFVTSQGDRGLLDARMEREAHAAASCHHPALVRVFDFGRTDQGNPYLVMELVRGASISAALRENGRMSATQAVRTMLPIVDGLRVAHQSGIIHRDVKPDNILIETDERGNEWPKLLDFGIAKISSITRWDMTEDGAILGTPDYMSPEQALGNGDVGAASDVWSVCATLYHLLVGTPPFRRTTYNALVQAILHEPVKPITEFGVGDIRLWRILQRGFVKDVARRVDSMTRLGAALAEWLIGNCITEDCSGKSLRAMWPEPSCHDHSSYISEFGDDTGAKHLPQPLPCAWSGELPRVSRAPSLRPIALMSGVLAMAAVVGVASHVRSTGRRSDFPAAGATVTAKHAEPQDPPRASAASACTNVSQTSEPPIRAIASVSSATSAAPHTKSTKLKPALRSRYHNFGF